MSHGTHMNESCHAHEWVMCITGMVEEFLVSGVTHIDRWYIYTHININVWSFVTHINSWSCVTHINSWSCVTHIDVLSCASSDMCYTCVCVCGTMDFNTALENTCKSVCVYNSMYVCVCVCACAHERVFVCLSVSLTLLSVCLSLCDMCMCICGCMYLCISFILMLRVLYFGTYIYIYQCIKLRYTYQCMMLRHIYQCMKLCEYRIVLPISMTHIN